MHPLCCAACVTPSQSSTQRSTNISRPWRR
jgi:hypothetical protein